MPNLAALTAVILAGGRGTRLQTVLPDRPKVLAPVHGRPFLTYMLDLWEQAGGRQVVLCTGFGASQVREALGERYNSLSLTYSEETQPLGTGGALRLAMECGVSDPLLVLNGDSFIRADLKDFYRWFAAVDGGMGMILTNVADPGRFGKVQFREDGLICQFIEKGSTSEPGWINTGVYLLTHQVLSTIPPGRYYSLEEELFPQLVGRNLYGYPCREEFIDIGTPESWERAEHFFSVAAPEE
jgi:D-glycero-alpha-D-manno-heptose 1-phosphate guanylyltransferase